MDNGGSPDPTIQPTTARHVQDEYYSELELPRDDLAAALEAEEQRNRDLQRRVAVQAELSRLRAENACLVTQLADGPSLATLGAAGRISATQTFKLGSLAKYMPKFAGKRGEDLAFCLQEWQRIMDQYGTHCPRQAQVGEVLLCLEGVAQSLIRSKPLPSSLPALFKLLKDAFWRSYQTHSQLGALFTPRRAGQSGLEALRLLDRDGEFQRLQAMGLPAVLGFEELKFAVAVSKLSDAEFSSWQLRADGLPELY